MTKVIATASLVLTLGVLVSSTLATSAEAQERPKPPQAAFDACKSRSEGDACSVEFRDQKVAGTCRKPPDGSGELVCFPAGPPPGGGGRQFQLLPSLRPVEGHPTCSMTVNEPGPQP